jgi:6-phosphogluconolactonase
MSDLRVRVLVSPAEVAKAAAQRIVAAASDAIFEKGTFSVVLSGGSTPENLYVKLAEKPFRDQIDWPKVEVFFGDERCVPPSHPESNYRMAFAALLSKVPIAPANVHRIRGELEPEQAAMEYGRMLKERFGDGGPDLVLLGMGDDGHTASLFPETAALDEQEHRCVANYVEKLHTWRITLTAPFINRANQVCVLVTGANKAQRVAEVVEGPQEPKRLPIQLIRPASGNLIWMMDSAAAGMA